MSDTTESVLGEDGDERDPTTGDSVTDGLTAVDDAFLARCDLRLYRDNVFRVAGLDHDAGAAAIRRRRQDLTMAANLGTVPTGGTRHPLDPPPDSVEIGRAFETLKDPRRRLYDELFWYWTPQGATAEPGSIEERHDGAVDEHLIALDLERATAAGPPDPDKSDRRDGAWVVALRRWAEVFDDPRTWEVLRERVARIDDPRLTTGAVRRMRRAAPRGVLLTSVRLAAESDQRAERHRALLDASPFPADLIESVRRQSVSGALDAADDALEQGWTRLRTTEDAAATRSELARAREETAPHQATVVRVLGADSRAAIALADRLAELTTQAAARLHNLGADGDAPTSVPAAREALALLRGIEDTDVGPATRQLCAEQIEVVASNLVGVVIAPYRKRSVDRMGDALRAWSRLSDEDPEVLAAVDEALTGPEAFGARVEWLPRMLTVGFVTATMMTGRAVGGGWLRKTYQLWLLFIPVLPIRAMLTRQEGDVVWFRQVPLTGLERIWQTATLAIVLFLLILMIEAPVSVAAPAVAGAALLLYGGRYSWDRASVRRAAQLPRRSDPTPGDGSDLDDPDAVFLDGSDTIGPDDIGSDDIGSGDVPAKPDPARLIVIDGTIDHMVGDEVCRTLRELADHSFDDIHLCVTATAGSPSAVEMVGAVIDDITPDVVTYAVVEIGVPGLELVRRGTRGRRLVCQGTVVHLGPGRRYATPEDAVRAGFVDGITAAPPTVGGLR